MSKNLSSAAVVIGALRVNYMDDLILLAPAKKEKNASENVDCLKVVCCTYFISTERS